MNTSAIWADPSQSSSSDSQSLVGHSSPSRPNQGADLEAAEIKKSPSLPNLSLPNRRSTGWESTMRKETSKRMFISFGLPQNYKRRISLVPGADSEGPRVRQNSTSSAAPEIPRGRLEEQVSRHNSSKALPKKQAIKRRYTIDPSMMGVEALKAIQALAKENAEKEPSFRAQSALHGSRRKEQQLKRQIMKLESKHNLVSLLAKKKSSGTLVKSGLLPAQKQRRKSVLVPPKLPACEPKLQRKRSMSATFEPAQFEQAQLATVTEVEKRLQRPPPSLQADIHERQRLPISPIKEVSNEHAREVSVKISDRGSYLGRPEFDETSKNLLRLKRMTYREKQKSCLIYPENKYKGYWDLFMTLVLLTSCILTPVDIAFKQISMESAFFVNLTLVMDILFGIDIIVIFNSCFYDDQVQLVENRKQIAAHYLRGWFTIDLFAIIPFELLLSAAAEFNSFVRVARVGRLYKLVKLARLLRILKLMRDRSRLLRYLHDFLKVGLGFERLFFFLIIFLLMCHISSCLWITIAGLLNTDDGFEDTWMENYMSEGTTSPGIYLTAFYWTATTITTVGYGDITGTNSLERFFCSLMMLVGVFAFSFANGSLASIIQNYDQTNAEYQEKMVVLNKIYKDYCLPLDLYIRLKQSLAYENQKVINDFNKFVQDLPHKLKVEVSLYIYEERYSKLKLFRGQTVAFISWLCPLLRPQFFGEKQYIFQEGDEITGIFFLVSGEASFVLPSYDNTPYISINEGDHFGLIDILGSSETKDFEADDWYFMRNLLQRQFSVSSIGTVELQTLSLQDLHRLHQEFVDIYEMMIESSIKQLRTAWVVKLEAIQKCSAQLAEMQEGQEEESHDLSAGSINNNAKRICYDIPVIDLSQFDEMVPTESSQSQELSSDEVASSQQIEGQQLKSSSESNTPTKKRQVENKIVGDDLFTLAPSVQRSALQDSKKGYSLPKNSMGTDPGVLSAASLCKLKTKTSQLLKSQSLYIDKKDLLSNQPLKATKAIQEEGQLILKKLELRMEDEKKKQTQPTNSSEPREVQSFGKRRSTAAVDGLFSFKLKPKRSVCPRDLQLGPQEKKVTFGEAHFTSSSSSASSSSSNQSFELGAEPVPAAPERTEDQGSIEEVPAQPHTSQGAARGSSSNEALAALSSQMNSLREESRSLRAEVIDMKMTLLERMASISAILGTTEKK